MSTLFQNHSIFSQVLKHASLPVYKTNEFSFFRCVNISEWVYVKTISCLHSDNLRVNNQLGRYSRLFPEEKISYWADSPATALAEIRKHGGNKDYLTFWAYDDSSSTFPTLGFDNNLTIIDGRDINFHDILLKIENNKKLNLHDMRIVNLVKLEKPDCLAYHSIVRKGHINFLFFENGFNKLSLREVKLHLGERKHGITKTIPCAITSDYLPVIESYGAYFEPIAKVRHDKTYCNTQEYQLRLKNYQSNRIF